MFLLLIGFWAINFNFMRGLGLKYFFLRVIKEAAIGQRGCYFPVFGYQLRRWILLACRV